MVKKIELLKLQLTKLDWGWVAIGATKQGICGLCLPRKTKQEAQAIAEEWKIQADRWSNGTDDPIIKKAVRQLKEYYSGLRREFDLPIDLSLGTDFRRKVWKTVMNIPYGETRSYGWVAHRVHNPKGARAIGGSMGANPIPPVMPCHRVVGHDQSLVGFGSGLPMKVQMLKLEGAALRSLR